MGAKTAPLHPIDDNKMSRKASGDLVSKPAKRAKTNANHVNTRGGTILRIRLENFMCHEHFEIDFVSGTNYIAGENGSGKSAILTALIVCLGTKARETKRAKKLTDFINKRGASYCLAAVTLSNGGEDAYKPEDYGSSITIERRIVQSGQSSFKLKDDSNQTISTSRSDVDCILDHFNIDVSNPIVVMSQDGSREFLHSNNPKLSYKFYMKATLMENIENDIVSMKSQLKTMEEHIRHKKMEYDERRQELERLLSELKELDKVRSMKEKVDILKKQLAWAYVQKKEDELNSKKKDRDNTESEIAKCIEKLSQYEELEKEYQQGLEKAKEAMEKIGAEANAGRERMNEMRTHIGQVRRHIKQIQTDLEYMIVDQKKTKKALLEAEKELENLSKKIETSTQLEHSSREARLEEKKARVTELEEEVESKKSALLEAQNKIDSSNQTLKSLRDENKQSEHERTTLRSKVQNLETQKNDKLNIWGSSVATVLRAVEARIRSFHRKPLGPLGRYLTLSDSKWALAIENAIGDTFGLFIVHDHHDSVLLKECFRDAKLQRLPIILIYNFDTPPYEPDPSELPDPSTTTILKTIESENPVITNILMDQSSIERVCLVEDEEQSSRVAFDPKMNKNVRSVYLPDGTVKFIRGRSQMIYPLKKRLQPRLGVSIEQLIVRYRGEISEKDKAIERIKVEVRNLTEDVRTAETEYKTAKSHLQRTKHILHQAEDDYKKEQEDVEKEDAGADEAKNRCLELTSHVEILKRSLDEKETQVKEQETNLEQVKDKEKEMKEGYDAYKTNLDEMENKNSEATNEASKLSNRLSQVDVRKESLNEKKLQLERKRQEYDKILGEERKELEEVQAQASSYCSEEELERVGGRSAKDPQELNQLIARFIQRISDEQGEKNFDELQRSSQRKQKIVDKLDRQLSHANEAKKRFEPAISQRVSLLRNTFQKNSREAALHFNALLHKKGFAGRICIDANTEMLTLSVATGSSSSVKDTRSLSGGERSFCTLAFTQSLALLIDTPFRAVDEADVFMDAATRKISYDIMFTANEYQSILLSPLSLPDSLNSDIKTFRMRKQASS